MRILSEAPGYATQENAIKAFGKELARHEMTPEDMRWMVIVNPEGRYSVAVDCSDDSQLMMKILHGMKKVCMF